MDNQTEHYVDYEHVRNSLSLLIDSVGLCCTPFWQRQSIKTSLMVIGSEREKPGVGMVITQVLHDDLYTDALVYRLKKFMAELLRTLGPIMWVPVRDMASLSRWELLSTIFTGRCTKIRRANIMVMLAWASIMLRCCTSFFGCGTKVLGESVGLAL